MPEYSKPRKITEVQGTGVIDYPTQTHIVRHEAPISDDLSVVIAVYRSTRTSESRSTSGEESLPQFMDKGVLMQAKLLDADMERLFQQYGEKAIAYYEGRVLVVEETEEDVIARIPEEYRQLPIVIRHLGRLKGPDFMGGPKGGLW